MSQHATGRRTALVAVALGLALAATACGGADGSVRLADGGSTQGGAAPAGDQTPAGDPRPTEPAEGEEQGPEPAQPAPAQPAPAQPAPAQPAPVQPAAPAAAAVLPDGTYEVVVLAAEDGTVVLDRGRFVLGEPQEPGVDSTRPVTFDTGTAAERLALPVADDARLVLQVAGVGTTTVPFEQLAQTVDARVGDLLATVTVSGGQVTALEQLYRP